MRSICLHNFSFWSVFSAQHPEHPPVTFRAPHIHTHSIRSAERGHRDWLSLPLFAERGDSSHSEPVTGESESVSCSVSHSLRPHGL